MKTYVSEISGGSLLYEMPAVAASPSLSAEKVANIDRLRVLAAIGIVWFHLGDVPYRQVAYAGLPVFLLIFFSLIACRGAAITTGQFLRRRYERLLKPWVFWSVVYGASRTMKFLWTGDLGALRELLSVQTLLAGTSIHLWYLPYAFVCGLLVYEFNRRTWQIGHVRLVLPATILGGSLLAAHATGVSCRGLTSPAAQWEFGLAAIPWGFAIGRCLAIPSGGLRRGLLAAMAAGMLVECCVLYTLGFRSATIPYGVAVTLVCLAYGVEGGSDGVVAALAPLTFGVYLLHPLVAHALSRWPAADGQSILFASLTVSISALITWTLLKTPMRSFL